MQSYGYHPNFGEVVPYEFTALPDDNDSQVTVTVNRLLENAREDMRSPWTMNAARKSLQLGQNPRLTPARQAINGVWAHVKDSMRFQQDEDQARLLHTSDPRIPDVIEVVIRPADMARLIESRGRGFEDCDGFTSYAACLLSILGVPVSLTTVSANHEEPEAYSHIYVVAYADGERIPLDFSHGDYPGWECPNTGRMKEWPMFPRWGVVEAVASMGIVFGLFYLASRYLKKAGTL